jgi:tryptophan-rich sensory protein
MTRKANRRPKAPRPSWGALAGWIAVGASAGALVTWMALDNARVSAALYREWWVLRSAGFGPAWTAASASAGVAAWLVWREPEAPARSTALGLFVAQLGVAALWAVMVFRWRQGPLAFADLLVLDLLVVATASAFWQVRRLAGALLLPYLAWVLYATAAGYRLWRDNRGILT